MYNEWLLSLRNENEIESLHEMRLVDDVERERVIFARENERESLLEARQAANGDRV